MSDTPPRDWAEVRAHLGQRMPRLLTTLVIGFVFFTGIALYHGAAWQHALLAGLVSVAVMASVIAVLVGGFVLLMVKTRYADGGD